MKKNDKVAKQVNDFIISLKSLEVTEMLGIFRMLNVPIMADNDEMRPFEDIITDVIGKYINLNRNQRRNLDAIIAVATEKEKKRKKKKKE